MTFVHRTEVNIRLHGKLSHQLIKELSLLLLSLNPATSHYSSSFCRRASFARLLLRHSFLPGNDNGFRNGCRCGCWCRAEGIPKRKNIVRHRWNGYVRVRVVINRLGWRCGFKRWYYRSRRGYGWFDNNRWLSRFFDNNRLICSCWYDNDRLIGSWWHDDDGLIGHIGRWLDDFSAAGCFDYHWLARWRSYRFSRWN